MMRRLATHKLVAGAALLGLTLSCGGGAADGKFTCMDLGVLVDGLAMSSSRSFAVNTRSASGYGVLTLFTSLTDANTSITRLDLTCTGSDDSNTTDYEFEDCTVSAGVATCVDGGVWQKASPGSTKFARRVDVNGVPDLECTYSVGTGSGGAPDLLSVRGRLCVN
jgi:hypothetical protein